MLKENCIQSLNLLFNACKPLTFDCMRSEKERSELISNITNYTYYCTDNIENPDNIKKDFTNDIDSSLNDNVFWIQSLCLLFVSCEPLIYDSDYNNEEINDIIKDISNHIFYCVGVKDCIENKIKTETWDEFIDKINFMKKLF